MPADPPNRFRFRRAQRLRSARDFQHVYDARAMKRSGPLRVHARPNTLDHNRLGLSVSRRVGSAVLRNRIKRRLREAFRLSQHQPPTGYDLIVVVLPHSPLPMAQYALHLADALARLHALWLRRARIERDKPATHAPPPITAQVHDPDRRP